MYSATEMKFDLNDLQNRISLVETQLRYLLDDVRYLKDKMDEQLKYNKKLEKSLAEREQFFIDAVIEMKKTFANLSKIKELNETTA